MKRKTLSVSLFKVYDVPTSQKYNICYFLKRLSAFLYLKNKLRNCLKNSFAINILKVYSDRLNSHIYFLPFKMMLKCADISRLEYDAYKELTIMFHVRDSPKKQNKFFCK